MRNLIIIILFSFFPIISNAQGKIDTSYKKEKSKKSTDKDCNSKSDKINGYEWVDLGLPSGTKWASSNIG